MNVITGDILEITKGTILHQVNCRAFVGGLAAALYKKWPAAFDDYVAFCKSHEERMAGRTIVTAATDSLKIAHVFGQIEPGATTELFIARSALCEAGKKISSGPVYAPYRMGCGIGGGNWDEYLSVLVGVFPDIIIVQREEDKS